MGVREGENPDPNADDEDYGDPGEGSLEDQLAQRDQELEDLRTKQAATEAKLAELSGKKDEESKAEAARLRQAQSRDASREAAVAAGIQAIKADPANPVNAVLMALAGELDEANAKVERLSQRVTSKEPDEDQEEIDALMDSGRFSSRADAHDALMGKRFKEGKLKPAADKGDEPPAVEEKVPAQMAGQRPPGTVTRNSGRVSSELTKISKDAYRERLHAARESIYGENGTRDGASKERKLVREVRAHRVRFDE